MLPRHTDPCAGPLSLGLSCPPTPPHPPPPLRLPPNQDVPPARGRRRRPLPAAGPGGGAAPAALLRPRAACQGGRAAAGHAAGQGLLPAGAGGQPGAEGVEAAGSYRSLGLDAIRMHHAPVQPGAQQLRARRRSPPASPTPPTPPSCLTFRTAGPGPLLRLRPMGARAPGCARGRRCCPPLQLLLLRSQEGVDLVARVTGTDTMSERERQEALGYHCYRGLLGPTTAVYWSAEQAEAPPGGRWGRAWGEVLCARLPARRCAAPGRAAVAVELRPAAAAGASRRCCPPYARTHARTHAPPPPQAKCRMPAAT
jgi:hypothetical protein